MILLIIYCVLSYLIILACIILDFVEREKESLDTGGQIFMFMFAPLIVLIGIVAAIVEKIRE